MNISRRFAKTYLRSFTGAHELIDAVMHTGRYAEAIEVLDAWLGVRKAGDGAA
jgi:hypothetical protein